MADLLQRGRERYLSAVQLFQYLAGWTCPRLSRDAALRRRPQLSKVQYPSSFSVDGSTTCLISA